MARLMENRSLEDQISTICRSQVYQNNDRLPFALDLIRKVISEQHSLEERLFKSVKKFLHRKTRGAAKSLTQAKNNASKLLHVRRSDLPELIRKDIYDRVPEQEQRLAELKSLTLVWDAFVIRQISSIDYWRKRPAAELSQRLENICSGLPHGLSYPQRVAIVEASLLAKVKVGPDIASGVVKFLDSTQRLWTYVLERKGSAVSGAGERTQLREDIEAFGKLSGRWQRSLRRRFGYFKKTSGKNPAA
jgi:hypothetical protein